VPNPSSLRPYTWAFGIAIVCCVCHREGACDRGDLDVPHIPPPVPVHLNVGWLMVNGALVS